MHWYSIATRFFESTDNVRKLIIFNFEKKLKFKYTVLPYHIIDIIIMSFETLLGEAKKSQENIAKYIEEKTSESQVQSETVVKKTKETYEKYYRKESDEIIFAKSLEYADLESKETCLPANFKNCLSYLKNYNCHIYEFEEDVSQKECNIEFSFGSDGKNTSVFMFVCRCNKWFFQCHLNMHNDIEDGIFMVHSFLNSETGYKFIHYVDIFGNNTSAFETEMIFEMLQAPSYSDFMTTKWKYLQDLFDKLNSDGYKNDAKINFELFPSCFNIEITEPIQITLLYSYDKIIINEEKKDYYNKEIMSISYKTNDDYELLKRMLQNYIKYYENKYGYFSDGKYWNDKQISEIFYRILDTHKTKYPEFYNNYHGNLAMYKGADEIRFLSQYKQHGIDLMNGVHCDISFRAEFGQYVVRTETATPEKSTSPDIKEEDKLVLHMIRAIGHEYEIYIFNVKLIEIKNDSPAGSHGDPIIMTQFIIKQFSSSKGLKNEVMFEGNFHEISTKINDYICKIYEAYNMPL